MGGCYDVGHRDLQQKMVPGGDCLTSSGKWYANSSILLHVADLTHQIVESNIRCQGGVIFTSVVLSPGVGVVFRLEVLTRKRSIAIDDSTNSALLNEYHERLL